MMINQNILAILRAFLNLQKKFHRKPYNKQTSAAATVQFLSKVPNKKNI